MAPYASSQERALPGLPLPVLQPSELVVAPADAVPGGWAGAPSAVAADGVIYLAYRLRRPVGQGRGYGNVVALSRDGVQVETVCEVFSEQFGAASLERPALVRTPQGRWRLYVSCATPESKHWRVDLLEADTPEGLASAVPVTVLPGSGEVAVKDPVVALVDGTWHLWASVHPLDSWDDADRMTTDYATSPDGVFWTWHGTVLSGRAGRWDARGVRVTSVVVQGDRLLASYDGRASAEANWEEVTGTAEGRRGPDGLFGALTPTDGEPLRSTYEPGGLRYLDVLHLDNGDARLYYEITRADGAHELRTELVRS